MGGQVRLYTDTTCQLLGVYDSFDAALEARDELAVAELSARRDWLTTTHLIVGMGDAGRVEVWPVTTCVGPPGEPGTLATADLDEIRHWLALIHGRAPD